MIGDSWEVGRVVWAEEELITMVEETARGYELRTYRRPAPGQTYRGTAAAPGYSPGVERG